MGSGIWVKHVGVTSFTDSFIYFADFPFEVFIEVRDILGDEASENIRDFFELLFVLLGVELKGTAEDATIVEGGHCHFGPVPCDNGRVFYAVQDAEVTH